MRRNNGQRRPALEALEGRFVPSALGAAGRASSALIRQLSNNEIIDPTGTPTPHEQRRQRFQATFSGPYVIGPGRFSGQSSQVFIRGAGTSNKFLHGDVLLKIATPTDPALPPTGALTMFDRNLNNGSQLGLVLTGVTGAVDRHGRPTQFTFTVDQTVSGGLFTQASGSGTVDVRYLASRPATGTALLRARGNIYTLGTTNILRNSDINP